jgi:hypothetical protein
MRRRFVTSRRRIDSLWDLTGMSGLLDRFRRDGGLFEFTAIVFADWTIDVGFVNFD